MGQLKEQLVTSLIAAWNSFRGSVVQLQEQLVTHLVAAWDSFRGSV